MDPTDKGDGQQQGGAVFEMTELVEILQQLVQQKSQNPPGEEEAVARRVQAILQENAVDSEMVWAQPGRPNIVARLHGQAPGPALIYNGHLDVVPAGPGWSVDPWGGIIRDGKLYGRGASDMKSGVAAMMYAAIVLKRMGNPFCGELILFFDVDEEQLNAGVKHFVGSGIQADYAVIGEPTELAVCIGHRGCTRFRLKTLGTPGHTSVVTRPDNAICKMAKVVDALATLGQEIRKRVHPVIGPLSLTVSKISGGTAVNIVPAACEIEIDRRTAPEESADQVSAEIREVVGQTAARFGFTYDLDCYQSVPATLIESGHPFVQKLADASRRIRGGPAQVKIFEATCEAPFFSVQMGIPTIIFGPGSLAQAHVVDEHVAIEEVEAASQIFLELALDVLRPQKESLMP